MPVIGKKALKELREYVRESIDHVPASMFRQNHELLGEIDLALKPKRSLKPAKARRAVKGKAHMEGIGEIRRGVFTRAGGRCEECERELDEIHLSVDHFFGGSGRRRALQSVETCWVLCSPCHIHKTRNFPSAKHWLENFIRHCEKYGYLNAGRLAQARLSSLELQGAKT